MWIVQTWKSQVGRGNFFMLCSYQDTTHDIFRMIQYNGKDTTWWICHWSLRWKNWHILIYNHEILVCGFTVFWNTVKSDNGCSANTTLSRTCLYQRPQFIWGFFVLFPDCASLLCTPFFSISKCPDAYRKLFFFPTTIIIWNWQIPKRQLCLAVAGGKTHTVCVAPWRLTKICFHGLEHCKC